MSIDALCNLPPDIPGTDASSTLLTGSSDGYVRAVQLFPTKLLGVVTDHGELPVERIAVGEGRRQLSIGPNTSKGLGQSIHRRGDDSDSDDDEKSHIRGPWWVGSVGHEEVLRMSNLEAFFRKGGKAHLDESEGDLEAALKIPSENEADADRFDAEAGNDEPANEEGDSDDEPEARQARKRKCKPEKVSLKIKKRKGKNEVEVDGAFFSEL